MQNFIVIMFLPTCICMARLIQVMISPKKYLNCVDFQPSTTVGRLIYFSTRMDVCVPRNHRKRKENFDFESLRVEGILFPGGLKPAEPNS